MKSSRTNRVLIIFLGIFILIHSIQFATRFFKINPLHGVTVQEDIQGLSSETWSNQLFQAELSNYLDFNFGFRPLYIRLNNQIQYSLYKQTNAQKISIGKNGYLYEDPYVISYFGGNFIGKETINNNLTKLRKIQKFLHAKNTELLIIITPSKAYYYPEYFPTKLITEKKVNNYEYYVDVLKQSSIPFIDFNAWFVDQKHNTDYPLITKNGTHWSQYGAVVAADSILKYLGHLLDMDVPGLIWEGIEVSNKPRSTDNDLEKLLNLAFPLPGPEYAYPINISSKADSNQVKPSALFIGDSYFWNIYFPAFKTSFQNLQYWYYNKYVVPDYSNKSIEVDDIDMIREMEQRDIVILFSSTENLKDLGFRFIGKVNDFLQKTPGEKRAYFIDRYKISILNSPDWLKDIQQKAMNRNIPLDSMIILDATYLADIRMEEFKMKQSE